MFDKFRTYPTSPSKEQFTYTLKQLTYARIDYWIDNVFNTWGWWFQLALLIISVVVWWKLVDKKHLFEITLYGLLVSTLSLWLDTVGFELGLWYYPVDLLPVFPPLTTVDYVILPVIYSLIYQYYRPWKSFITISFLLSGIFCFIAEPLLSKFGFYVVIKWKYYYGFPIYPAMGIILKAIVEKMKFIIAKHQQ